MCELVSCVLVYVGRHVAVKHLEGLLKGRVAQSKFVILLPKVGFKNLCRRQKTQNGDITTTQAAASCIRLGHTPARQPATDWKERRCPPETQALEE